MFCGESVKSLGPQLVSYSFLTHVLPARANSFNSLPYGTQSGPHDLAFSPSIRTQLESFAVAHHGFQKATVWKCIVSMRRQNDLITQHVCRVVISSAPVEGSEVR